MGLLKVFTEFVIILFLLYVLCFFFGHEACEILAPWSRDQTLFIGTPTGPPERISLYMTDIDVYSVGPMSKTGLLIIGYVSFHL